MVKDIVKGKITVISKEITDFESENFKNAIQDLTDTFYKGGHATCVGLAACQIGINDRIILVKDNNKVLIMVNPEILEQKGNQLGMEGCLSFPEVYKNIERPVRIKIKYQTILGNTKNQTYNGFTARIICHEVDHLNGICKVGE